VTPRIAVIGTLDTKGAEIEYVRRRLEALGARAVVIDAGVLGEPGCAAEVKSATRAAAGRR
jgi:uncharacterized protein (UPF0261 family)